MTRNAGIYVRISLDPNGTRLGVTRQTQACTDKAKDLGWTIHHIYEDNDVSASSAKPRPAYEHLLTDLRAGTIDAVIVWDLDRLTRRPIEIEQFITLADEHNIALASVGGDIDLATDNGRLFARIKGAVARAEIERRSARMKAANAQRRAAGIHRTGVRPFGYTTDRTAIVEHEAAWIRKSVADLLDGRPLAVVTTAINAAGVTTTRGNPWQRTELRRTLRHPRNAAILTHHDQIVGPAAWPAILDEDTYRAICELFDNPDRRGNPRSDISLLTSIAICDVCEAPIYCTRSGITVPRRYYCSARWHIGRAADPIDAHVEEVVRAILAQTDTGSDVHASPDNTGIAAARAKVEDLRDRLDRFTDAAADGSLSPAALVRIERRLTPQIKAAQRELTALTRPKILSRYDLTATDLWDVLEHDERRTLLRELFTIRIKSPGRGARRFDPATVVITPIW